MTDRVSRTAEVYDVISDKYAQNKEQAYSYAEIDNFTSHVAPGSRIASVGCGTGRDIQLFQERGYSVVGLDISEALLKIGNEQHPLLPFILADMRRLPFASESFEGIWAHECVHHLERQDIVPTLQEFHRILASDGLLFILTRQGTGNVKVREPMSSGEEREYTLLEPEELHNMLTLAGFEPVELYTFNERKRKEGGRDLHWISAFYRKAEP